MKTKKKPQPRLPKFKSDEEIASFMENHDPFDLIDKGLAEIVPTPSFVRKQETAPTLLKEKRVQVAFRDERSLQKTFSARFSSSRTFFVVDTDTSGILLGLPDSPTAGFFTSPI